MKRLFACMLRFFSVFTGACAPMAENIAVSTPVPAAVPLQGYVIGIDAGHGGRDQGAQGSFTGVSEAKLNLLVAQQLSAQLQQAGACIVMTRTDDEVIYAEGEDTFKQRDMRYRAHLINESDCDILISIHMNFFEDAKYGGAQVFYQPGSEAGAVLAQAVQQAIVFGLQADNTRKAQAQDLHMLRETNCPAILLECGLLSNRQDEVNLNSAEYREELCGCIVQGICTYLNGGI